MKTKSNKIGNPEFKCYNEYYSDCIYGELDSKNPYIYNCKFQRQDKDFPMKEFVCCNTKAQMFKMMEVLKEFGIEFYNPFKDIKTCNNLSHVENKKGS